MSHTPNDAKISAALLGRFLTGECTAEEEIRVREWTAHGPLATGIVELLAKYQAHRVVPERPVDADMMRQRILERITVGGRTRRRVGTRGWMPQPSRGRGWYGVAGLVVVAFVVIIGWNGWGHRSQPGQSPAVSTYVTTNGQRATITLSDGSTVALNVASRLEVPVDYATGDRTVHLTGEALFTVSRQAQRPFTVIAGSTVTRVLGTCFIVRHYATDTTVTVAVRDGRVAVGSTVVTAARLVEIGPRGAGRSQPADLSRFSFATGVLTLGRMPLSIAIPELDRWYNADVRLGDPALASQSMKGEFTAGSLADLTALLELTFNARVVRDGRVLTMYPR